MLIAFHFACASQRAASVPRPESPATLHELALDAARSGMSQEQYSAMTRLLSDSMLEVMEKQFAAEHRKLPPNLRQIVSDIYGQYISYDQQCDWMAETYARNFTPTELREIAAYRRGATFQKEMKLLPEVMKNVSQHVQQALTDHHEEIRAQLAARLRTADAPQSP
jgi:hypothetical protein